MALNQLSQFYYALSSHLVRMPRNNHVYPLLLFSPMLSHIIELKSFSSCTYSRLPSIVPSAFCCALAPSGVLYILFIFYTKGFYCLALSIRGATALLPCSSTSAALFFSHCVFALPSFWYCANVLCFRFMLGTARLRHSPNHSL